MTHAITNETAAPAHLPSESPTVSAPPVVPFAPPASITTMFPHVAQRYAAITISAAPEQERADRLLAAGHLGAHVQRRLDPKERKDREREEREVRGEAERERVTLEGVPSGPEVGRGRVALEQPPHPGETDQEDRRRVEPEQHVHVVLRDAHLQVGHQRAEPDHEKDDDADLPVLGEDAGELAVRVDEHGELLQEIREQDPDEHQRDRAWPPRHEAGEESPEGTEHLVRPDVERALLGEHPPELGRHERPGDQERQERDDPEDEHRWAGELQSGRVVDEQHDRNEDHDEVERSESPRDEDRRDLLGDHLFVGSVSHSTLPLLKGGAADPSEERSHPVIDRRESLHLNGDLSS